MDFKFRIGKSRNNIRFKPNWRGVQSISDIWVTVAIYPRKTYNIICNGEMQDPQIDNEITVNYNFLI